MQRGRIAQELPSGCEAVVRCLESIEKRWLLRCVTADWGQLTSFTRFSVLLVRPLQPPPFWIRPVTTPKIFNYWGCFTRPRLSKNKTIIIKWLIIQLATKLWDCNIYFRQQQIHRPRRATWYCLWTVSDIELCIPFNLFSYALKNELINTLFRTRGIIDKIWIKLYTLTTEQFHMSRKEYDEA